jgi:dTDP-D-glucose 4,6-dehydratase
MAVKTTATFYNVRRWPVGYFYSNTVLKTRSAFFLRTVKYFFERFKSQKKSLVTHVLDRNKRLIRYLVDDDKIFPSLAL